MLSLRAAKQITLTIVGYGEEEVRIPKKKAPFHKVKRNGVKTPSLTVVVLPNPKNKGKYVVPYKTRANSRCLYLTGSLK